VASFIEDYALIGDCHTAALLRAMDRSIGCVFRALIRALVLRRF
jgi:hypothetical protein